MRPNMRRFLASPWFPLVICVMMAAATTVSFSMIYPKSPEMPRAFFDGLNVATVLTGPFMGAISLACIGILNRFKKRYGKWKNALLHCVIILGCITPWFFIGRSMPNTIYYFPLMWGSLIATGIMAVIAIPSILLRK